jgi:hypothetical protein
VHLIQIPPDAGPDGRSPLQTLWPAIAPLLERAVEYSDGMTTLEEQRIAIAEKRHQLWVVATNGKQIIAAAVSTLQKFPSGLVLATITLLGGDNGSIKDLIELRAEFESWAKVEGCNRVRFFARKGWARYLPDYKLAAYVMSKEL